MQLQRDWTALILGQQPAVHSVPGFQQLYHIKNNDANMGTPPQDILMLSATSQGHKMLLYRTEAESNTSGTAVNSCWLSEQP